jgi:hypothetical protein
MESIMQWNEAPPARLPVAVSPGFLGAGKTQLLSYVLANREQRRVAVFVNDRSEVNIDAAQVRDGSAGRARTEEQLALGSDWIRSASNSYACLLTECEFDLGPIAWLALEYPVPPIEPESEEIA